MSKKQKKVKATQNKAKDTKTPKELDIKSLNVTQLKALAYDEMAKIDQARNNLVLINDQIASKRPPN